MHKTLYRDPNHKFIGGVAAGLANYWNTDVSLIRILLIVLIFIGRLWIGTSVVVYIILWIILPEQNRSLSEDISDHSSQNTKNDTASFEADYLVKEGKEKGFDGDNLMNDPENRLNPPRMGQNKIGGIILLIIGLIILINQNLDWDFSILDRFWPIGIILLGVYLLYTSIKRKK